ncbi:SEC-C metal-binding domain-containing protein [Rossellomorea vietnamensis]|uniref:SEC-C metal-binding domain-containing protein n=1 Tax=Rossellomorea vietnamensis TaxID=218284 RepID=UPI0030863178|nr:SEC-C metal-binding domain-containing protein [Rossellomorea vietnamensis]
MNRFVERVEPYFLSEDPFVQRYAIEMLEGSYLVDGDTFLTGLKAHDRGQVSVYSSPILPYLMYMPLNEEGMEEVVNRLNSLSKKDADVLFYIQLVANADTELLISYRNEVKPFIDEEQLKKIAKLPTLKEEELFMELAGVMHYLDTNGYDQVYFDYGKRIVHELVKQGKIESWEVQIKEDELGDFNLVYTVYMAGEIREESVIPQLVNLFKDEEAEDLLLEEVANALVKIGTDQVVREVEKVALYGNTYFYTLDVLGRIKSPEAEQALLRLFDQTDDLTAKTLIADYLCQQLSAEAIPKIEALIEEGYDENMLCLEESLYVNCVMNGIDLPKLPQWKSLIEEVEKHSLEEQPLLVTQPVQTEDKGGRNDPCPCGSGKKYKKCCL